MVELPLSWKLSIQGAEEVKTKLREINEQFERGDISASEYSKALRSVNRDARSFVATTTLQRNIFLATHPAFNQLSRAASALNSVTRTALAISNALNLMWLRQQGTSSALAQAQFEVMQAQREVNDLMNKGLTDTIEYADAQERLNIALKRLDELAQGDTMKGITDFITVIGSVGLAISGGIKGFEKLAPLAQKLAPFFKSLGAIGGGAVAGAGIFGAIAVGVALAAEEMFKFLTGLDNLDKWREDNRQKVVNLFTKDIPLALGQAGAFLANFFLSDIPTWAKQGFIIIGNIFIGALNGLIAGFENFLNKIVSAINILIRKANKLPGVNISQLSKVSLGRIPAIAAAEGFEGTVRQPTLFLAGERGPEQVSIVPSGGGRGGGQQIIIQVHGSIWSEKILLNKIDEHLKDTLKRRGFQGSFDS